MTSMRFGIGYDVHPFEAGRRLVLGGVEIPAERGLAGHSDADVLLHAVMDGLLGAAGLDDIGVHFPPTDERWRDADSRQLLALVVDMLEGRWRIVNVDVTLIAEEPKIGPWRRQIRESLARSLGLPVEQANIKATTNEHLGFVGRGEGIAAIAVAAIESR